MKSTYLLSPFLLLFFAASAFCQKTCDTLVTQDGRRIAVEISSSNSEGVFFSKCEESDDRQYFLESGKILEIRGHNAVVKKPKLEPETPKPVTPKPKAEPLPPTFSPLKTETDLSKPKTILWAGLVLSNLFLFDLDLSENSFFQFGAEVGFKNKLTRLGVFVQPILVGRTDYYNDFQKTGVNGQLGFVLKNFSRGRLTGNVSKAYWGLDVYFGQQAFQYTSSSTAPQTTREKTTWTSVMPRIGFQFNVDMFAFDIGLPIGYQRYHYTRTGNYNYEYKEGVLAIQPSATFGLRF